MKQGRLMQVRISYAFIILVCSILVGCTHYHILPLYVVENPATAEKKTFYAVSQNTIIIPEYTIDGQGRYPQSRDIAKTVFTERKSKLYHDVHEKYDIPWTIPYQIERWFCVIGLTAVSPITIPLLWTNSYPPDGQHTSRYHSFSKTVKNYFSNAYYGVVSYEPQLKDKYKIITIIECT